VTTGIRWLSVGPGSGLGDAAEVYLSGLRAAGIPVSWTPLGWPSPVWGTVYGPVSATSLNGTTHRDIADIPVPHDTVVVCSTPLWHEQLRVETEARQLVAYTAWETDRLPAASVGILNRYDRVLVPSRFNADVFAASGVTVAVFVVPHIARARVSTGAPPRSDEKFVFYMISTWTTRKAILDTVSAYLAAFTAADQVRLVIHTTPEDLVARARVGHGAAPAEAHHRTTWFTLAEALAGREDAPEISLSTNPLRREQIEALHARGDCFVSLSRGEGWGLGAFDAAVFGNPVIVTGWGGTLDFLPPDYPYCVDYDLVSTMAEEADDWWRPVAGERWAKARIEHAASLMRHVYEHQDQARESGRTLQSTVSTTFAEPRVTHQLIGALR
jgi:glycosyltransferase involved in cell wall biosynthesis